MTHDRINLRRRKQEGTPKCQINLRNRKARLQTVIRRVTGKDLDQITPEATFQSLECDSLETVEITIETETEFNIDIDDEKMPELEHKVSDFVKVIDEALNGR